MARRVITAREQRELAEPFLRLAADEPLADWEKDLMAQSEPVEIALPSGITGDIIQKHYPDNSAQNTSDLAKQWSYNGDLDAQREAVNEHLTMLTTPGHSFYSKGVGSNAEKWKGIHEDAFGEPWTGDAQQSDKGTSVAESASKAFAPAGIKVKTMDEFFKDHAPPGSGPKAKGTGPKPKDSPTPQGYLNDFIDQASSPTWFGDPDDDWTAEAEAIKTPAFGDWFTKKYPNGTDNGDPLWPDVVAGEYFKEKKFGPENTSSDDDYNQIQELLKPVGTPPPADTPDTSDMGENLQNFFLTDADEENEYGDLADNDHFKDWFNKEYPDFDHGDLFASDIVNEYQCPWNAFNYHDQPVWMQNMSYGQSVYNDINDWQREVGAEQIHEWKDDYHDGGSDAIQSFHEYLDNQQIDHPDDLDVSMYVSEGVDTTDDDYSYWKQNLPYGAHEYFEENPQDGNYDLADWQAWNNGENLHYKSNWPEGPHQVAYSQIYSDQPYEVNAPDSLKDGYDSFVTGFKAYMLTQLPDLEQDNVSGFDRGEWSELEQGWNNLSQYDKNKLVDFEENNLHPNQPGEDFVPTSVAPAFTPTPIPTGPAVPFATPFSTNEDGIPTTEAGLNAMADTLWGDSVGSAAKKSWVSSQLSGDSNVSSEFLEKHYPQEWKSWQIQQSGAKASTPQVTSQMVIDHLTSQPGSAWKWNPDNHSNSSQGLLDLVNETPEQLKATLESWGSGEAQKTLDDLFGAGAQQETASSTFHKQLVTSPEFKAWFKKDNSGFDLDDPSAKQQRDMLLDPTNDWTMGKLIQFKNAQDKIKGSSGAFSPENFTADYQAAFPSTSWGVNDFTNPEKSKAVLTGIIEEDLSDGVGHYDGDDDFDRDEEGPNFPDYGEYEDAVNEWQQQKDKAQDLYDKYFGSDSFSVGQGAPAYDLGQDDAANQFGQLLNDQPFYNWVTGKTGEVDAKTQMFYQKYPQYALDAWSAKGGQGGSATPTSSYTPQDIAYDANVLGWNVTSSLYQTYTMEQIKANLDNIVSKEHATVAAKAQKLLDKFFGSGASAPAAPAAWKPPAHMSVPQALLGPDGGLAPGVLQWMKKEYPGGDEKKKDAANWLAWISGVASGGGGQGWTPGDWGVVAEKWNSTDQDYWKGQPIPEGLAAAAGQPAPAAALPFDAAQAAIEYGEILGIGPGVKDGDGLKYQDMSYGEFKKKVVDKIQKAKDGDGYYSSLLGKFQDLYDKWFSEPQSATFQGPVDLGDTAPLKIPVVPGTTPASVMSGDGLSPDFEKWLWASMVPGISPESFLGAIAGWTPEHWTMAENAFLGKNQLAAAPAVTPAAGSYAPDYTGPPVEWLAKNYSSSTMYYDDKLKTSEPWSPENIQKWWSEGGDRSHAGEQWKGDKYGDKADFSINSDASVAKGGAADFDPMAFAQDAAAAFGANPDIANSGGKKFKDMTYDEAEASMAELVADSGAAGLWPWQPVYDKYFGGSAAAPVAPGAHDYDKIAQLAKKMSHNGGGSYYTDTPDWLTWVHGLDPFDIADLANDVPSANDAFKDFLQGDDDNYSALKKWYDDKSDTDDAFYLLAKNPKEFGKVYDQWKSESSGNPGTFTEEPETPAVGTGIPKGDHTPSDMLAADGTYTQLAIDFMKQSGWPVPGEKIHHESWSESSWDAVLTMPGTASAAYLDQPGGKPLSWEDFKQAYGDKQTEVAAPGKPNFYDQFQAITNHDPAKVEKNKNNIAEKGVDWLKDQIKKRLKAETDPEKFVKLVDLWQKNFGGPTGSGAITPLLKKLKPGQPLNQAAMMALWQLKDTGELPDWIKDAPTDTSGDIWPTYEEQEDPLGVSSAAPSADTAPSSPKLPQPEYDKVAFSEEVANVLGAGALDYGSAGWAKKALQAHILHEKKLGYNNAEEDYGHIQTANALQKVYDKWFGEPSSGGGMTMTEIKAMIKAADPEHWGKSFNTHKFGNYDEKEWIKELESLIASSADNPSAFLPGEVNAYKEVIPQLKKLIDSSPKPSAEGFDPGLSESPNAPLATPPEQYPPGVSSWGGSGQGSAPAPSMSDIVRGQISTMVDKLRAPESDGTYSQEDIAIAQSPVFQKWFRDAPAPYRQTTSQFPFIALEDYARGGEYTWVPEGTGDIARVYDPYRYPESEQRGGYVKGPGGENLKLPGEWRGKHWPSNTRNPKAGDEGTRGSGRPTLKFPNRPPDVPGQLEIPLPDGSSWQSDKEWPTLRRALDINFDLYKPGRSNYDKLKMVGAEGDQHRRAAQLLDEIKELVVGRQSIQKNSEMPEVSGSGFFRNPPRQTLFDGGDNFVDGQPEVPYLSRDSNAVDKWLQLMKWAGENKVPPEQMWQVARDAGHSDPEMFGTPPQSYFIEQSKRDPKRMAAEVARLTGDDFEADSLYAVSKKLKKIKNETDRDYDEDTRFRAANLYEKWFGAGFLSDMLAHKIVEYVESGAYKPSDFYDHPNVGGMGPHWTTKDKDNVDFGKDSPSEKGMPVQIVVEWPGQGEDPDGKDGAHGHTHEKEITLNPGTKVRVKQLVMQHPYHGENDNSYDHKHIIYDFDKPQWRHAAVTPRRQGRAVLTHQERFAADDDPRADFDVWPDPYENRPSNYGQPTSLKTPRYDEHTRPQHNNGEYYFSPDEINPPSDASSRPGIKWVGHEPEQDVLPDIDFPDEVAPGMPVDRHAQPLFRGLSLDLTHPDAAEIHRMVYGHHPDDQHMFDLDHEPQARYDHPELARAILDHLENSHQPTHGLGRHWSVDPSEAHGFAISEALSLLNDPDSVQLPVRLRADWKGAGENPYRHETGETGGEFSGEMEMNMLPGANMNIGDVQIRHPGLNRWVSLDHQPQHRHAQHATVRPRNAKRILTHQEMMEG